MFKHTIKGLMEDYKGFKYKMDEVMPFVKVMQAKLENKAYEVYFKALYTSYRQKYAVAKMGLRPYLHSTDTPESV